MDTKFYQPESQHTVGRPMTCLYLASLEWNREGVNQRHHIEICATRQDADMRRLL